MKKANLTRKKTYEKASTFISRAQYEKNSCLMQTSVHETLSDENGDWHNGAKEFSGVGFSDLWLLDDEFSTGEDEEEEDQYASILRYNTLMK